MTGKISKATIFDNSKLRYGIEKVYELTGCDLIMNGGVFDFGTLKPGCKLKINGKVIVNDEFKVWGLGWDDSNISLMHSDNMGKVKNYISFVTIILNGVKEYPYGAQAQMAPSRRAAIGLTIDGSVLPYCGTTLQTIDELTAYMLSQGCVNAIMLDGGGSVQRKSNKPNETVVSSDKPARVVANYICFWFEGENRIIDAGLKFGTLVPRASTEYLMYHHAAGDASVTAVHNYHTAHFGWPGIAYHYYVRKNGQIFYGRPENAKGSHCSAGKPANNSNAIAVCLEGNFEVEQMPPAQIESGAWLSKYIASKYPGIIPTVHNKNSATVCPGKNFPFAAISAGIKADYIVDIKAKRLTLGTAAQASERVASLRALDCDAEII